MAWYDYGGFAPYVSQAQRRAQAAREARQLAKQGVKLRPVLIEGRAIATTFWGKAWCEHLERYADFANRLPRGRTYARNGSVMDLQISTGEVRAMVSGSEIYDARVAVQPVAPARKRALARECAGKIDSVVELLAGELSDGVMKVLCRPENGLFPSTRELSMSCSCPDGAWLCKHLAAVLYGVGARLDEEPGLLFVLRGVDQTELVSHAAEKAMAGHRGATGGLERGSLSEVFGIELDGEPAPEETVRAASPGKQTRAKAPRLSASAKARPRGVVAKLRAVVEDHRSALAELKSAARKLGRRRG